jgi:gliding motility-associated-like protein
MKKLVYILFIFYCAQAYTQKQTAYWHFGTFAGLDFNSGSPIAFSGSQLTTVEGCASISSPNGQLLFYTDGVTVWNRNNQIMLNGENLNGDKSSTNSAIIIPKPDDINTYYIFTVDDVAGSNGLQYTEVDMLSDGGLGGINTSRKNILLYAPTLEKLTAVKHQNDTDWWVLTHNWNSDEFITYRVSNGGISPPITKPIGINISGATASTIGCMKFSPDGSKIAIAHSYDNNIVQLFDFDDLTGDITNPITLTGFNTGTGPGGNRGVYGIEFSPNSNLLYTTDSGGYIYQYNLDLPSSTAIINSKVEIENSTLKFGALQIAPDAKIYVAIENYSYLGVINSPNTIGISSDYIAEGVFLSGGSSTLGLPPFIQSFFWKAVDVEYTCFGDNTSFTLVDPELSQTWNFGDPSSGANNTSTDVNPIHTYTSPGTYSGEVLVTNSLGITSPTPFSVVISEIPIANQPIDYVDCDNDEDTDSNNGVIQTFLLSTKDSEILGTQDPTLYEVSYFEDTSFTQKIDKTIEYENSSPNNQPIYAKIFNSNDQTCFDTVQFDLIVNELPDFDLPEEKIICSNDLPDSVEPENPQGTYIYSWILDDGTVYSTNQILTFNDVSSIPNTTGLSLTLIATDQMNSCTSSKPILIRKIIPAVFTQNDIIVNDLSDNNTVTISPQDPNFNTSDYEFALGDPSGMIGSYQSELIFENVTPGIKILYIRDIYNCDKTNLEISIIGFPKYFTPNNDGTNDTWHVLGVNRNFYSASIIKIFDRFGKLIKTVSPNSEGWDGFYNGKELPETDYWFNVQLINSAGETREHNGHFSLIRR